MLSVSCLTLFYADRMRPHLNITSTYPLRFIPHYLQLNYLQLNLYHLILTSFYHLILTSFYLTTSLLTPHTSTTPHK